MFALRKNGFNLMNPTPRPSVYEVSERQGPVVIAQVDSSSKTYIMHTM